MTSGWAACQAGDTKRGLALLQKGKRGWEATGAKFSTTRNATQIAEAYILTGLPEVALEHLATARGHGVSFGELYTAAEVCLVTAMAIQASHGPSSDVEAQLKEALADRSLSARSAIRAPGGSGSRPPLEPPGARGRGNPSARPTLYMVHRRTYTSRSGRGQNVAG